MDSTIDYYDPFQGEGTFTSSINDLLQSWYCQVGKSHADFRCTNMICPRQIGKNDCGVVLILNIMAIMLNHIPDYEYESALMRNLLKSSLITGRIDQKIIQTVTSSLN